MQPVTFWMLIDSLKSGRVIELEWSGKGKAVTGKVTSIQAEDSSGHCWNIVLYHPDRGNQNVFVRTID